MFTPKDVFRNSQWIETVRKRTASGGMISLSILAFSGLFTCLLNIKSCFLGRSVSHSENVEENAPTRTEPKVLNTNVERINSTHLFESRSLICINIVIFAECLRTLVYVQKFPKYTFIEMELTTARPTRIPNLIFKSLASCRKKTGRPEKCVYFRIYRIVCTQIGSSAINGLKMIVTYFPRWCGNECRAL